MIARFRCANHEKGICFGMGKKGVGAIRATARWDLRACHEQMWRWEEERMGQLKIIEWRRERDQRNDENFGKIRRGKIK